MNNKEISVIKQLVKITQNQQKILTRLAQAATDQNIEYLRRAAQVAAVNNSFATTEVYATYNPPSQSNNTYVEGGYSVVVKGAPSDNQIRQKYIDTLKSQVNAQKPELGKNLSITFED